MSSRKVSVLGETRYSESRKAFPFFGKVYYRSPTKRRVPLVLLVVEQSGKTGVPARERGKGLEAVFVYAEKS